MPATQRPANPVPKRWQPRFGLGGLMLLMLVCSVMAAAGYYFVHAARVGRAYQMAFIVVTLVAPLLLTIIISNLRALLVSRRKR